MQAGEVVVAEALRPLHRDGAGGIYSHIVTKCGVVLAKIACRGGLESLVDCKILDCALPGVGVGAGISLSRVSAG